MELTMFKSKLHQMRVTEANLMYEGSITIDQELLELADLLPYEKVSVVNITNGSRLETYTIPGERGSRVCCMNGAAARLTQVDDRIIVISYARMSREEAEAHKPVVVVVDENNNPRNVIREPAHGQSFGLENGLIENKN
ncbi:MAG: aspartate 1-decarboxylase [Balneolaceae bacterium]|jgi:aspartate 1-decarboxylase|nr:MAG: aspartate 1-decarboxylase [Balneolaceae bacterium]